MITTMFFIVLALAGLNLLLRPLVRPVACLLKGVLVLLLVFFLASLFMPVDSKPRPALSEEGDKTIVNLN
jgi:hypothetical protein